MNRPAALVCYICGREFGTKSLAFHIKACEKKWENEENLKPPKLRRPCPQPPAALSSLLGKEVISRNDINQFNVKSFDSYVEEALVECEYCGRRFNQKSLVPHQKACKTHPMIRKPYINKGPMGKQPESEQLQKVPSKGYSFKPEMGSQQVGNLVPCRKCGRTFMPDRVNKHQRVCKADPVEVAKPQPKFEKKSQPKMKPNFKQKKAKWKVQHQELQNAMKMMRQIRGVEARGGKISDLPPPPPSNYDHYVQCRHCGRKYAADVAERHIPKCANIINKPGGIKPSRIQDKYVAGTGTTNKSNVYPQAVQKNIGGMPLKPNFSTNSGMSSGLESIGASNGNNKPFKSSFTGNSYGSKQQTSPSRGGPVISSQGSKGYGNSSPFGGKMSSGPKQGGPPMGSYQIAGSNLKPNLKNNSKSNANKYW